jgi:UDP-N-acetylglucosamine 2-epimerase (non-hydrolysing)
MAPEIHIVAAARPNFMKVAPLYRLLKVADWCSPTLVHTGQHYDAQMSDIFFQQFRLPTPDIHLGVGSGSHAEQTAGVMVAYERICMTRPPALVIVVGDVNSTLACTLVAKKLCLPVAHLEAGLRSGDRAMPEEINRIATDAISDLFWTHSPDADAHLRREGIPVEKIERVGNMMIDCFEMMRTSIAQRRYFQEFDLAPKSFGVATIHRPSNVDDKTTFSALVSQLEASARKLPLIFPIHPRTRRRLEEFGLTDRLKGLILTDPLGYVEFMSLVSEARLVITDSGGIQEETSYLGIPCLTARDTTERPITITHGTNRLVRPSEIAQSVSDILDGKFVKRGPPEFWDGRTAGRIADSLRAWLNRKETLLPASTMSA